MNIIYTIKDDAVDAYGPPFHVRAQGEAIRMFMDEATNKDSRINRHPRDFALYKIGAYNDQTGEITGQTPERVSKATDFLGDEK